eukprot:CAMPEP_0168690110 /NCGR_PEP_ID=MMETSP0503-20121227/31974_1 /TAXON_ID=89963 /ORGANISM="Heterocapsa rotundata, Strain SCCAP K-0483" /LENGTH=266 /DNA_ID=CAMNT_0008735443 /DNA_START=11 /DNA_END=809 /DNA_ORIENTATION=+
MTTTTATVSTSLLPESGAVREFYMYRAEEAWTEAGRPNYPFENVNAGNLRGVLWYLHSEVVYACPWHHWIDRIRRVKITTLGGTFIPFVAFDMGMCTVPGCGLRWKEQGYRPGCQHMDFPPNFTTPLQWFSLPGKCPSQIYGEKTQECEEAEPGGACDKVKVITGQEHCTYHTEEAGFVMLDDATFPGMHGHSPDWVDLCELGGMSYNKTLDRGVNTHWWDGYKSLEKFNWRLHQLETAFAKKYPDVGLFPRRGAERDPGSKSRAT